MSPIGVFAIRFVIAWCCFVLWYDYCGVQFNLHNFMSKRQGWLYSYKNVKVTFYKLYFNILDIFNSQPYKYDKRPRFSTWSSANFNSAATGSAPGDSTKINGVILVESLNDPGRSKGGGSMYFWPILSRTNSCTAGMTLSGRMQRNTSMRWKPSSLP